MLSPKAQVERQVDVETPARALTGGSVGEEGLLVSLAGVAEHAFARPFTATEIQAVRQALTGGDIHRVADTDEGHAPVVGYVCIGRATGSLQAGSVVAVTDHVGLTWRSPLRGPDDERIGPRFPVVEGLYVPETVIERLGRSWDVVERVVAGVEDEGHLTESEAEAVEVSGLEVASRELVPVALLAAHLGIRLAAAVVIIEREQDKGDG